MSDEITPRFGLAMLVPGQAQKELYHNEALALIDLAMQAVVVALGEVTPPTAPTPGQCWIVGSSATGAWSGRADHIAGWTAGGWRFVAPADGMTVWSLADGVEARFAAGDWRLGVLRCRQLLVDGQAVIGSQQAAIGGPAGGTTIDAEARAAIDAVLTALRSHGLIAS